MTTMIDLDRIAAALQTPGPWTATCGEVGAPVVITPEFVRALIGYIQADNGYAELVAAMDKVLG